MTATDTETKLHDYEGNPVVVSKIEIPDAAGGLRDALAVDPIELAYRDEGYLVLHWRVKKIRHEPAGKDHSDDELARVHVLTTLNAAFIEEDQVGAYVRESADRVAKKIEELKGIQRLDDHLEQDELDAQRFEELVAARRPAPLRPRRWLPGVRRAR